MSSSNTKIPGNVPVRGTDVKARSQVPVSAWLTNDQRATGQSDPWGALVKNVHSKASQRTLKSVDLGISNNQSFTKYVLVILSSYCL